MRPTSGGRAVLELRGEDAAAGVVRYAAELYLPEAEFRAEVTIGLADGAVVAGAWTPAGPPPPAWLVKYATTFLRSAWRDRQKDATVEWPSRINRWREERE
jgi:hypothetical protein